MDNRIIRLGDRVFDYAKLDSATKYPSILTYHFVDEKNRGKMNGEINPDFEELDINDLFCCEKLDGTNCRVIILGQDYLVGGRDAIYYAKGDRIFNPANCIVEGIMSSFCNVVAPDDDKIYVVYGEIYGGSLPATKNYTSNKKNIGFRIFDVRTVVPDILNDDCIEKICYDREHFNSEGDHMRWYTIEELQTNNSNQIQFVTESDVITRSYQNIIHSMNVGTIRFPKDIESSYEYMIYLGRCSNYCLDEVVDNKCEGYVFRNQNRSKIFKMRFEDYERTIFGHKNASEEEIQTWIEHRFK